MAWLRPYSVPFALLAVACGGNTLEPVGAAGTGASAGSGGSAASGGSAGSGGSSATGGGAGTGGSNTCTTPNPAGCIQNGCNTGLFCDTTVSECISSGCACDDGAWSCTPDCGGGKCVPDSEATYHVRVGYVQGQESTGEFCVAYETDSNDQPIPDPAGLMATNGFSPTDFAGMDKLSRYLPLAKKPVAFGKAYVSCKSGVDDPLNHINWAKVPEGATYFTFLSVPYSGEADSLWVLPDSGPGTQHFPGLRVINASYYALPVDVSVDFGDATPISLGTFEFANAPSDYTDPGGISNHLHGMTVVDSTRSPSSHEFDFTHFDLLPLVSTTVFVVAGKLEAYAVLACFDSSNSAHPMYSSCWYVPQQ